MMNVKFNKLTKIAINGYKSINNCLLDMRAINVFIGANGAGKSNFLSIFELLQSVLARGLSHHGAKKGKDTLFFNGRDSTDKIHAEFYFNNDLYGFVIEWAENNQLFIQQENLVIDNNELIGKGGVSESRGMNILRNLTTQSSISPIMLNPSWIVYRFQNTTASSMKKGEQNLSNNVGFMAEGQNLAVFLYRIKNTFPKEYNDILYAVQLVAPYINNFVLLPDEINDAYITLRWQEKGCENVFGASQFSDGTLRFICLATLLLQPAALQPDVIIIDEPELGLHPYAVIIFAELVKKIAASKQVILSTQSVELLNQFIPEDVIVVDKGEKGTSFTRLNSEALHMWLEDEYTLGELWNKNILGGRFIQ